MFKALAFMMQNNAFLLFKMAPCLKHAGIRVSADTKLGRHALLLRFSAKNLRLPASCVCLLANTQVF
jgi:hypothetical protein